MGRMFEKRKHKMFARNAKMAVQFTRIAKEIAIAVRLGGPDPDSNSRLRAVVQNSKSANMPKDRVDAAIKRAVSKDTENYEEVIYEGYAPHGVAVVIETATDNPTRTVANIRMYLTRSNGTLGTKGSLDFLFDRKGIFKLMKNELNTEELELELIDYGAEEVFEEDGHVFIYTSFSNFGPLQKALDEKEVEVVSTQLQRIPLNTVKLAENEENEVLELIEKLENDEDVQAVFHNLG
jgi:YebC/PmpR family DNA-binding regulatory protein